MLKTGLDFAEQYLLPKRKDRMNQVENPSATAGMFYYSSNNDSIHLKNILPLNWEQIDDLFNSKGLSEPISMIDARALGSD